LMHIQFSLSEDVFQTLVISVDMTDVTQQIMAPSLQCMDNSC
jgi:hypothetical protein